MSSSRTFTGGTSVRWAGMRPSVPSPRARRRPSASVAAGSGRSRTTPNRRRDIGGTLALLAGRAGRHRCIAGGLLLQPLECVAHGVRHRLHVALPLVVDAALDHLTL